LSCKSVAHFHPPWNTSNKTTPIYRRRKTGKDFFLIYITALLCGAQIGQNAKLLLTLIFNNGLFDAAGVYRWWEQSSYKSYCIAWDGPGWLKCAILTDPAI
jgi:hypothetical protein